MIYAYLRVSTASQVLDNQQSEVEEFARRKGITIDVIVEEVVSGTTRNSDRKLGRLLRKLKPGDVLIVSEISRLSRKLTEIILSFSIFCTNKSVSRPWAWPDGRGAL